MESSVPQLSFLQQFWRTSSYQQDQWYTNAYYIKNILACWVGWRVSEESFPSSTTDCITEQASILSKSQAILGHSLECSSSIRLSGKTLAKKECSCVHFCHYDPTSASYLFRDSSVNRSLLSEAKFSKFTQSREGDAFTCKSCKICLPSLTQGWLYEILLLVISPELLRFISD